MRAIVLLAVVATALALTACNRGEAAYPDFFGSGGRGHYASVGIYSPSKQWADLVRGQAPADPQAALPRDDQVILVVQDTVSGEVRACGDLTGYCIGMNPWKTALAPTQMVPLKLVAHAADPDAAAAATPGTTPTHRRRHVRVRRADS